MKDFLWYSNGILSLCSASKRDDILVGYGAEVIGQAQLFMPSVFVKTVRPCIVTESLIAENKDDMPCRQTIKVALEGELASRGLSVVTSKSESLIATGEEKRMLEIAVKIKSEKLTKRAKIINKILELL